MLQKNNGFHQKKRVVHYSVEQMEYEKNKNSINNFQNIIDNFSENGTKGVLNVLYWEFSEEIFKKK